MVEYTCTNILVTLICWELVQSQTNPESMILMYYSWNSVTRSSLTLLFLFFLQGGGDFVPVVVGRSVLESLHHSEVLVKQLGAPLGNRYYRSIIPDISITICSSCNKVHSQGEERYLFHVEHVYIVLAVSCHFVVEEDTIPVF